MSSDALGYLASALVLAAFCMKDMIPLRVVALCSNLAFMTYGLCLGLAPIWVLHAVLLPINGWRLWELLRAPRRAAQPGTVLKFLQAALAPLTPLRDDEFSHHYQTTRLRNEN